MLIPFFSLLSCLFVLLGTLVGIIVGGVFGLAMVLFIGMYFLSPATLGFKPKGTNADVKKMHEGESPFAIPISGVLRVGGTDRGSLDRL